MFDGLRKLFAKQPPAPQILPSLSRDEVTHVFVQDHEMPHIDWGIAEAWMKSRRPGDLSPDDAKRALIACWLDEVRDVQESDFRRWRRGIVEGVAPVDKAIAPRIADCAEQSLKIIGNAMTPIRGDGPILPIAIVAFGANDPYYSFVSHYYPDSGSFATSGGIYIRSAVNDYPMLVINGSSSHGIESTVAHELTHHALVHCNLPLWAEEGLTQMMEERVTGQTTFVVDRHALNKHRETWADCGLESFADGSSFQSPEGFVQECSYELAQIIVRSLLAQRPKDFFAFARACASTAPDLAAKQHLGASVVELAEPIVSD